jgi:hypothetical protein
MSPLGASTLHLIRGYRPPGQRVAAPGQAGDISFSHYIRGTSNSTAMATRGAARLYEVIQGLRQEEGNRELAEVETSLLLKTLLVHGASWLTVQEKLSVLLPESNKQLMTRFLGYGPVDLERVLTSTDQRVTLLGGGRLTDNEADLYEFPLPDSLSSVSGLRRLTVTLSWFTPINTRHQLYRKAALWVSPHGVAKDDGRFKDKLGVERKQVDNKATMRGTVQHEVFEGRKATPFANNDKVELQVNCRANTGALEESVPYAIAVTLEVAPDSPIQVYQEVLAKIRAPVRVAP